MACASFSRASLGLPAFTLSLCLSRRGVVGCDVVRCGEVRCGEVRCGVERVVGEATVARRVCATKANSARARGAISSEKRTCGPVQLPMAVAAALLLPASPSLFSLSRSLCLSLSFLPLPRRVSSRTLACPQSPPPAARRSHAPLRFQASCHLPRRANRLPLLRDTALSIERVVFLLLCCACVSPLRFLRSSSPPLCATASCPLSAAPPPLPSASLRSSRRLAQRTHHTPPLLPFCARELRRHLTHVPRPARYRVRASSEHRHLIRR